MKKLTFPFLLCLIIISTAFGQAQRNDYQKIDYLKVSPNDVEQFMNLAHNELKSNYQSLVESGDLKSWKLYKVQYPGGEKSNYNFVSISIASSLNAFGQDFSEMATAEVIPAGMSTNGNNNFGKLCTPIKSELWKVENNIQRPDSASTISPYMTMDYMNVALGKSYDYLMLEDEIAKPMHEARVEKNRMEGWEVYSLIIPGGTQYGYNYATGNYFAKLDHIEFGFSNEIIRQTQGANSNIPELFNTIYSTRDLVQRELWELVAHTEK